MSKDKSQSQTEDQIESYSKEVVRDAPSGLEYMNPGVHGSKHIKDIQNLLHDNVSGSAIAVHNNKVDNLGKLLQISTKGITVTLAELAAIETYSDWNLTGVTDGAINFETNCESIPQIQYGELNKHSPREYRSEPNDIIYVDPSEKEIIEKEIERISSGFVHPDHSINGENLYYTSRTPSENIYIYQIEGEENEHHMKISTHDFYMTSFNIAFIHKASAWNFIGVKNGNVMFNGSPNSETKHPDELQEIGRSLLYSPIPLHVEMLQ